ncbi:MAG: hypothetical protein ACR2K4_03875 [Candidatus Limnocylindria bacterium]
MTGRTIFRVVAVLLLMAVAIGTGTAVYNAGVTAGLAEAAQQAAAAGDPVAVVPGGYYGWGGPYAHGFFGFGFGFIFWILGIFLVIGLVRGAFDRDRWGRHGGPGGPGGSPALSGRIAESCPGARLTAKKAPISASAWPILAHRRRFRPRRAPYRPQLGR